MVQQRRKAKQQQIERRLLVRQSSKEEQARNLDRRGLPRDREGEATSLLRNQIRGKGSTAPR